MEAADANKDTETKAHIHGVSALMKTFKYHFGNKLGEMILRHTDNLSSTLQNKYLSASENQQIAQMTQDTLQTLRTDASFDLFWTKVSNWQILTAYQSINSLDRESNPKQLPLDQVSILMLHPT